MPCRRLARPGMGQLARVDQNLEELVEISVRCLDEDTAIASHRNGQIPAGIRPTMFRHPFKPLILE